MGAVASEAGRRGQKADIPHARHVDSQVAGDRRGGGGGSGGQGVAAASMIVAAAHHEVDLTQAGVATRQQWIAMVLADARRLGGSTEEPVLGHGRRAGALVPVCVRCETPRFGMCISMLRHKQVALCSFGWEERVGFG